MYHYSVVVWKLAGTKGAIFIVLCMPSGLLLTDMLHKVLNGIRGGMICFLTCEMGKPMPTCELLETM